MGDSYHSILIVGEREPSKWDGIKSAYNDIFFLRGDISSMDVFSKVNIEHAYSFVLMCVGGQETLGASAIASQPTQKNAHVAFVRMLLYQFLPLPIRIPRTAGRGERRCCYTFHILEA